VLLKLSERLRDVAGDGRFFRDDEGFSHVTRHSLSREAWFAQLIFYFDPADFNHGWTDKHG
jgi:hypothetical protein